MFNTNSNLAFEQIRSYCLRPVYTQRERERVQREHERERDF